jgi:hypothetical protein
MKQLNGMYRVLTCAIVCRFTPLAVLGLFAAQTAAHHAFSSVFDPELPLNLEGKVTKVEWMNPHTWFYIDVSNSDGDVENWGFEMGSPNTLARRGWSRDSLRVGDEIIVVGWRARDGTKRGAVGSVTLTDGQQLFGAQDLSR